MSFSPIPSITCCTDKRLRSLIIHQIGDRLPPSDSDILKLVEFEDDHDRHGLQYDPSTKFDLRFCYPNGHILVLGSVNGLLCFCDFENEALYACNPAVRQWVSLAESQHKKHCLLRYSFMGSDLALRR
ncbi:hypothetical protein Acr_05g0001850 [Actinidia rufa]|uniref:Uncharacterized protein n=1 Tax=Actinidia rufa TaxID=165716 RepID=A0A7J0EK13_9ERIC|nr:hypothetical protein Acr_05g0001850 [Actinidia rufa]